MRHCLYRIFDKTNSISILVLKKQSAGLITGDVPEGIHRTDKAVVLFRIGETRRAAIHPQQVEGVGVFRHAAGHRLLIEKADAADVMGLAAGAQRRSGKNGQGEKQSVVHLGQLNNGPTRLWLDP